MLTRRQAVLMALLTLMWGVNWPMMKFSLREITPLWFRALTMTAGVLTLAAFYLWRGTDLRLKRSDAPRVALLALPNIVGWHLFSILGLAALASGRAAILGFTMPVWTVLLAVGLGAEKLTRRVLFSAAAALAAVLLLSAQEWTGLAGKPLGVLWMQGAALCWAAGTLMMRRTTLAMTTEGVTVWMMAFGAVVFWIAAPLAEPVPRFAGFSAGMWWSLAYGAFINFGFAQVIWFGMARDLPPTASAFSIMAVPLVGLAGATVLVGEVPHGTDLAAALCIVAAIAAALIRRPAIAGDRGGSTA
jgi:drug/metabolite transporter (DMT)-like permease